MEFYICILSKKDDIQRRKSITKQLKNLKFNDFIFFDAYTPEKNHSYIINNISNNNLSMGEYCCSLGHIDILKKFLASTKDYLIVVEDDALFLSQDFGKIFNLKEYFNISDVLILGYSKVTIPLRKAIQFFRPSYSIIKSNGIELKLPYKQWKCGTVCYAINKIGAKKIIELNFPVSVTADDWNYFEDNGVNILHISPLLVLEDINNHPSNIEKERNTLKQRSLFLRYIAGIIRHIFLLKRIRKYFNLKNKCKKIYGRK